MADEERAPLPYKAQVRQRLARGIAEQQEQRPTTDPESVGAALRKLNNKGAQNG